MLDFAGNSNTLGKRTALITHLKKNAHRVGEYADNNNTEILAAISKYFGVHGGNIALGIGSTQLLFDVPNLIPYKRALVPVPTFWEYTAFNTLWKKKMKKLVFTEKNDFAPDYQLLDLEIKPGDCVFIANVNSPSSLLYDRNELLRLIKKHPHTQFVIDETYLVFRKDYKKQSLLGEASRRKNLIVITSVSKFFGLAGVRLGFMVAHRDIITRYNQYFHIPYSVGMFTQLAFTKQIQDTAGATRARKLFDDERVRVFKIIKDKFSDRLYPIRPDGNFVLCKIETKQRSLELQRKLEKLGIHLRGGHELLDVSDKWIRFTLRSKKDNQKLIKALDIVLR
jgi:threonine-phosphate decarboxylase